MKYLSVCHLINVFLPSNCAPTVVSNLGDCANRLLSFLEYVIGAWSMLVVLLGHQEHQEDLNHIILILRSGYDP